MMWHSGQPGLVNTSTSGSSPVTNGIFSSVRAPTAVSSVMGREAGGSRSAHTTDSKTAPTAIATMTCCRDPVEPCCCAGECSGGPEAGFNGLLVDRLIKTFRSQTRNDLYDFPPRAVLRAYSNTHLALNQFHELIEPTGFVLTVRCQLVDQIGKNTSQL